MCFSPFTAGNTSVCSPFASSLRDRMPRSATLRFLLLPGGGATGTAAACALKKCIVLTVGGYAVASGDDALAAAAAAEAKSGTDEDELDALNGPAAAVQLLRFFDCQTSFADGQCMLLLSMLSDVERWKRKRFFNETVLCRRRDDPKWEGTDIALVFQLRSGDELEALGRIKTAVVTVLRAQGRSVSEMCAEIDVDNDATLAVDEIVRFFSTPAMQAAEGMPTPAELQGLRHAIKACCDLNGDSSISYEEMRRVFTDKLKVRASLSTCYPPTREALISRTGTWSFTSAYEWSRPINYRVEPVWPGTKSKRKAKPGLTLKVVEQLLDETLAVQWIKIRRCGWLPVKIGPKTMVVDVTSAAGGAHPLVS